MSHAAPPPGRQGPRPGAAAPPEADPTRLLAQRLRPVFAVTGAVVGLYLLNALLAAQAREFLGIQVVGPLNIGLALGLLQCVTTVWAGRWYARHAQASLDPLGAGLRAPYGGQEGER
ncbi:DUF485 domain-containing protein [Streptomyces sp. 8N706]|uniref:DUF485 domain-containing protein n=1 Tax=Streptomyces sp. 8N706 TaxID=3457416 RepID=UPI003FD4699A